MYTRIVILLAALFIWDTGLADEIKVYPTPQVMKSTGKDLVLDSDIVLMGGDKASPSAVRQLRQLFPINDNKKGYRIYIGEKTDPAVKKYSPEIPDISGAYYLSVNDERMIIIGNDERGTFYALQTLAQLKRGDTLPEIEIFDHPGIAYRGVVEGFYGQPWSYEDRVSQIVFYGQHKLNVYIYGPKDDPYHSSPDWRKPYPQKAAEQISGLVTLSKANQVDFVWAIHPGQDIKWNDEDRKALLDKFENMYALGVRSFAVFFDDISGEGTDPVRQAELLNFIDEQFVALKPDVTPLIMCPTEYNKSWANPKPDTYLDILGDKLNKRIMIMWTGDRVISDITGEGLDWVNERINRPAYVWWNFPVSDYVRDHLLMGPAYGLDPLARLKMSGFVSNPMERAEASKIAIASVADYSWNPAVYNSNDSWEHAIRSVMPQAPEAFRTFAAHNSDLGKNGHKYRRDESVEIKPIVEVFLKNYKEGHINQEAAIQVVREFEKIKATPEQLRTTTNNPALLSEISSWLEQFEVLGLAGAAAVELASSDLTDDAGQVWNRYTELLLLEAQKEYIDKTNNRNPYQPGVKTGSLVMQPFVDTIVKIAGNRLYRRLSGQKIVMNTTVHPSLYTDIEQLKNLQLQLNERSVAITPMLEVIRIQPDGYVGIELPLFTSNIKIAIDLNTTSAQTWGTVEVSSNGSDWEKVKMTAKDTELTADWADKAVRYIAFVNHGTDTKEIYLKKFVITSEELTADKNNPALSGDGNLKTAYTLQEGQSVSFNNPAFSNSTEFSLLLTPRNKIGLTVTAIDKNNTSHDLGVMTDTMATFRCPAGTRTIRLTSRGEAVNIHEVIWK